MARAPFKMKGSPMQRNFGIGSSLRTDPNPKKKKKKESKKRVDMSTTELLKQKWAEYQASLSKDHEDYGKPVPTQLP